MDRPDSHPSKDGPLASVIPLFNDEFRGEAD